MVYRPQVEPKQRQNARLSIKNAEFLYKIPQIEVDYTKNRPNLGLFYFVNSSYISNYFDLHFF